MSAFGKRIDGPAGRRRAPPRQVSVLGSAVTINGAKSVIVEDDIGFVMAIVPADRNVQLGQLSRLLDREHLRLADENRIAAMFTDCDRGAVPALGMAWGMPTVIDDELEANEVVYLESGDHERLL